MSGTETSLLNEFSNTYIVASSICPTIIISLYDSNGRQMPSANCKTGHTIFAFSRESQSGACT